MMADNTGATRALSGAAAYSLCAWANTGIARGVLAMMALGGLIGVTILSGDRKGKGDGNAD
jgi:hypothetical protein